MPSPSLSFFILVVFVQDALPSTLCKNAVLVTAAITKTSGFFCLKGGGPNRGTLSLPRFWMFVKRSTIRRPCPSPPPSGDKFFFFFFLPSSPPERTNEENGIQEGRGGRFLQRISLSFCPPKLYSCHTQWNLGNRRQSRKEEGGRTAASPTPPSLFLRGRRRKASSSHKNRCGKKNQCEIARTLNI